MARELQPLDITHVPDLRELVEEVRRSKTTADYAAFRASAGSWKGVVDTERLKRDIAASRRISTRPPIEL